MRQEQAYRVTWKYVVQPDPFTGKPKIVVVFPHKVPVRIRTWRDRIRGSVDALLALAVMVLAVISLVVR